jgi:hypothetical protein
MAPRPVLLGCCTLLLLSGSPHGAGQSPQDIIDQFKPDKHVWRLEAQIDRQGSGHDQRSSNGGRTVSTYDRTVTDIVTLTACGQAGVWAVTSVKWNFRDETERRKESTAASTTCPPPPEAKDHNVLYRMKHYPPDVRKPGDKQIDVQQGLQTLYPGQGDAALVAGASAGVMELPGGKAMLSVRAQALLQVTRSEVSELHRVCDGDVVRKESRWETCAPGCTGETKISPPAENGSQMTMQTSPPLPWLSGFGERIDFPKDVGQAISGTKPLGEKKPSREGDYSETSVAQWTLEPTDPCEQVRALIEQDLAWTDAFLDRSLLEESGGDADTMSRLVEQRMIGDQGGGQAQPSSQDVHVDMSVRSDCKIHGADDFRQASLEKCEPRIITDALMAHEERHVRQCEWHRDNGSTAFSHPTAEGYALAEASAHLAGIRKALSWYEDHCSGETVSLRQRMAAAEQKLAGTPW